MNALPRISPTSDPKSLHMMDMRVSGMRCAGCAGRLEDAVGGVPNVSAVNADHVRGLVSFAYAGENQNTQIIADAITGAGFVVVGRAQNDDNDVSAEDATATPHQNWILAGAVVLTLPLLVSMIANAVQMPDLVLPPLWQLILATPVQFVAGSSFYIGAWRSLKAGVGSMDTLVALGTTAAFTTSLAAIWFETGGALHFGGAAAVITFVLVGKAIEARAVQNAGDAVQGLITLVPKSATRLIAGPDGSPESIFEQPTPLAHLTIGDVIRVRAGDRIPADGLIIRGDSDVDEAHLTGESLPRSVHMDDTVFAGTLNGLGGLDIRLTALGRDSRLGETITALRAARAGKSPLQRQADRVARVFVPAVVLIAVGTVLTWGLMGFGWIPGLEAAAAVLVVSCPCALGIAAPMAIAVGVSRSARAGVLFRRPDAFEALAAADTVIFDKTGTLTFGQPTVSAVTPEAGPEANIDDDDVIRAAATAAQGASHPLAVAIARRANQHSLISAEAETTDTIPGQGMTAQVGKTRIAVGNARMMAEVCGLSITEPDDIGTHAWVAQATESHEWALLGLIQFTDGERPTAKRTVDRLRNMGIKAMMMSGDHASACAPVAHSLGLSDVQSGMTPAEKAEAVQRLQAEGRTVAMVGDGVNDSPALAAASVGMAMGAGTDIAAAAGSVVLSRDDPAQVISALKIARAVRRNIRQNLFWAFAYNTAAIPLAAAGILTPAIAGAAMALSSLCVVGNALRLQRADVDEREGSAS